MLPCWHLYSLFAQRTGQGLHLRGQVTCITCAMLGCIAQLLDRGCGYNKVAHLLQREINLDINFVMALSAFLFALR
jgi:hypothetical protein